MLAMVYLRQQLDDTYVASKTQGEKKMTKARWIILTILAASGFVLGRLAVRAFLNLLLGGTMFGGNLL